MNINKKFYTKSQDNLAYIEEPEVITMDSFNKAPWVSTYYFNTKPFINENIIIPFYCTNYKQSEYLKDSCVKIMVEIEKDGDIIRKIVNAGNNANSYSLSILCGDTKLDSDCVAVNVCPIIQNSGSFYMVRKTTKSVTGKIKIRNYFETWTISEVYIARTGGLERR